MMERKIINCKKTCSVRSGLLGVRFNKVFYEGNYLHLYRDDAYLTCIDLTDAYLKYQKHSNNYFNYYILMKKE